MVGTLIQDLQFAVRTLWRGSLLALTAILTLALAIGANVTKVSFFDGIFLNPLLP